MNQAQNLGRSNKFNNFEKYQVLTLLLIPTGKKEEADLLLFYKDPNPDDEKIIQVSIRSA